MTNNWFKYLARLYLPVYQYESETAKIIYAGYSLIKKNYYVNLLLTGDNHHTFLGRRLFWKIPDLLKTHNPDMIVSEISPIALSHFQKCNGYVVPEWITMKINIDRPISEICNRHVSDFSDVLRKIRKYKLTYEVLKEKENFEHFYNNFYLPYITKRHGEEAWIEDLNVMWSSSPSPFLIAIKEDGVIVAEAIVKKSEESLFLLRLGVLDGIEEYRNHGVIGAIYYFGILEAQKMGCHDLDVGGTRPFLTNGLTKFKFGLGAEIVSNHSFKKNYLWLGVNEHSIAAKEFLGSNPFMHLNKDLGLSRSLS